ncbi:MAG: endonuclease/exonuclease/phosphatase family protein [Firmicutes bacterium]|nr:endonuclease/exonuclease/phosphatase family protein [Bacillota bacterium]
MEKTLRILQQNLDSENENIEELMDTLLDKNPQVLLFSEFCYKYKRKDKISKLHKHEIIDRLRELGYDFYLPCECGDLEDPENKYWGGEICIMAVKKGIEFQQRERKNIDLSGRYIEGKLTFEKKISIEILFVHVPQTFPDPEKSNEYNRSREKKKENMLDEICHFWNEYKNKEVFIAGDFNTEINGSTSCEDIFKPLYDAANDTTRHEKTWRPKPDLDYIKCLDYALVSKPLYRCGCKTTLLETTSDHKALLTEIKID